MNWTKSTFSGDSSCIELSTLPDGMVALRDSKNPDAGHLSFTRAEVDAFVKGARAGEFDRFI